jgi:AraC-like DNA-binding protein
MTASLIISGIAVAAFLLSLMLGKKNKLPADKFLILYLLFFIVSQGYFYFETQGTFLHTSWMLLGRGIYLLGGPLFFYYVFTLTTSRTISRGIYVLTLLPFFAYAVNFFYYYVVGFPGQQVDIENGLLYINGSLSVAWTIFVFLLVISDPVYLAWFYVLLRRYKLQSVEAVSNLDRINLRWLNMVFILWAILVVIFVPLLAFSVGQNWFGSGWIAALLQAGYLAFIFLLGFFGFRQSVVFAVTNQSQSEDKNRPAAYERSGLTPEQAARYHERLLQYMKDSKPYITGELTAQQLAAQLDMTPNHLSQVINQREGKNFFDFINSYRVEEVKQKMADSRNSHLTLLALALESGFNSKSSFNAVFKKLTGETPSQYYKAQNLSEK